MLKLEGPTMALIGTFLIAYLLIGTINADTSVRISCLYNVLFVTSLFRTPFCVKHTFFSLLKLLISTFALKVANLANFEPLTIIISEESL